METSKMVDELRAEMKALRKQIMQFMKIHNNPHDTCKHDEMARKLQLIEQVLQDKKVELPTSDGKDNSDETDVSDETDTSDGNLSTMKEALEQARKKAGEALATVKDLNAQQVNIDDTEKAKIEAYIAKADEFLQAYKDAEETEKKAFDSANSGYVAEIKQSRNWNANHFLPRAEGGNSDNSDDTTDGGTDDQNTDDNSSDNTTDDSSTPQPSSGLSAAVGKNSLNTPADVKKVQELLNKVKGGLTVDGNIGANTIGAIERYQRSIFNGWSDGVISPSGKTWQNLAAGKGNAEVVADSGSTGSGGNKVFYLGNHIASIPSGASGSMHLVVLFGGAAYATPKWMMSETPSEYFSRALVYIVPQRTGIAGARTAYTPFFQGKGITVSSVSICGFSGGGQDIQQAGGSFKVKGLIDPFTTSGMINGFSAGSNVIMEYNTYNWGNPYWETKRTLPTLAAKVKNSGGHAEQVSVAHAGFPAHFLKKFANKIL